MTGFAQTAADNGFCAAVQSVTEALRASCADPADAIRLLLELLAYQPAVAPSASPIGGAMALLQSSMGLLFQASALVSLANACATYQPGSWDDAIDLRARVAGAFNAGIVAVADAGMDATYASLRGLRTAVLVDLTTRGAELAHLMTVQSAAPQNALTLAWRLYQDASRADELIREAGPDHPAFMPISFQALDS